MNLAPKSGLPDIFRLAIKHFEWNTSTNAMTPVWLLFQRDPVRTQLANRGLVQAAEYGGPSRPPRIVNRVAVPRPPGEIKSVDSLNLLSVLNAIAASLGNAGVWSYEEHVSGSARTFRLWFREP